MGASRNADGQGNIPDETEQTLALHDQLKAKGTLDEDRSAWFDGLTITHDAAGHTMLDGAVRDQTARYGLIAKVRDLHLALVVIEQRTTVMDTNPAAPPEVPTTSATDRRTIGCHTHDR
jgi:hypothetical protein